MGSLKRILGVGMMLVLLWASVGWTQYVQRVNCGGGQFRDHAGNLWAADQMYASGGWGRQDAWEYVNSSPIPNTVDDALYQQTVYALDWYRFTVPNGEYQVTLKFAEPFYGPGGRIYSIRVEGNMVLDHFDLAAAVGKSMAYDVISNVNVTDGLLQIDFIHHPPNAHAFICAIQVLQVGSTPAQLKVDRNSLHLNFDNVYDSFSIMNEGDQNLTWNIIENPEAVWITRIEPNSGTLGKLQTTSAKIEINRAGLAYGNYQGSIQINSNGGTHIITIYMSVQPPTPNYQHQPTALNFGGILNKQRFVIKNTGTGVGNWSVANQQAIPWLTDVNPTGNSLKPLVGDTVILTVDRTNLSPGIYGQTLNITTDTKPISIPLQLKVGKDTLRINCGGEEYISPKNVHWVPDLWNKGGSVNYIFENVKNTEDEPLFQNARFDEMSYHFPIQQNGIYVINLYFVELHYRARNHRVFNVLIEKQSVLENYDLFSTVGFGVADKKTYQVEVRDQQIDIEFKSVQRAPKICAIEIYRVSGPPVITSARQITVLEDQLLKYEPVANDPDNQPVTFEFKNLPSWLEVVGQTVQGIPTEGVPDTSFEVIASDGLTSSSIKVRVDVVPVNDAPQLISGVAAIACEDSLFSYIPVAMDPENDKISFQFINYPAWLTPGDSLIAGIPGEDAVDTSFQVIAADESNADTLTVMVQVLEMNDAPRLLSASHVEAVEDSLFRYIANAVDPEGDSLSYQFEAYPNWLTPEQNILKGTVPRDAADASFRVIATDGELADTLLVTVSVRQVNHSPEIKGFPTIEFPFNSSYQIELDKFVTDPDDSVQTLTWEAVYDCPNIEVNIDSMHLATFKAIAPDSIEILFRVTDPAGAKDSVKVVVKAQPVSAIDRLNQEMPQDYVLAPAYPNPFNPETTIRFALPQAENVQVQIYNLNGKLVKNLVNRHCEAGWQVVQWTGIDDDAKSVSSGTYFVILQAGHVKQVQKVTLIR